MNFKFLSALSILLLTGCISKTRETELLSEISKLEQSIDDCQNGETKLIAKIRLANEKNNNQQVKDLFNEFEKRHPDSKFYSEAKKINDAVTKIELEIAEKERKRIEKEQQEKLVAIKKLKKNFDDVSGTTWYKNPYFTHYSNSNHTSIYIGNKSTISWLRLTMSYTGEDWIFFEKAFLSYEGNTWEVPFDKYEEKETDNNNGVWEWIDVSIPEHRIDFLMGLANSKNAKMRLSGKYTKTRRLTWNERQGIKDVLNGYKVLKEANK